MRATLKSPRSEIDDPLKRCPPRVRESKKALSARRAASPRLEKIVNLRAPVLPLYESERMIATLEAQQHPRARKKKRAAWEWPEQYDSVARPTTAFVEHTSRLEQLTISSGRLRRAPTTALKPVKALPPLKF